MSFDATRLYELLPAVYRIRDKEQGEPLRGLLGVIATEVAVIEEDLAQLYDDQFIETCAPWVIPYISDLLGHPIRHDIPPSGVSLRAEVANTVKYRRRKGTSAMLEQLARDATNWDARVVEFFQLLACTQHVNHLRPDCLYSPDLRKWEAGERVNTAFDKLSHTVDVRQGASGGGGYNNSNIGIFLWRLNAYPVTESTAFGKTHADEHGRIQHHKSHFFFHPLGCNTQLFTRRVPNDQIIHLADAINVAMPISQVVLGRCLPDYYGPEKSINIEVWDGNEAEHKYTSVPADRIEVYDLSSWAHLPGHGRVAIDPQLGRIAFGTEQESPPRVTFHYGFSANLGGGEYDRAATFEARTRPLGLDPEEVSTTKNKTIHAALEKTKKGGVVKICDSRCYEDEFEISVAENARVELRAANGCRPTVSSEKLVIKGCEDSDVTLNGLMIKGTLHVSGPLRRLRLRHCTLVSGKYPSLIVEDRQPNLTIDIDHCITGGLQIDEAAAVLINDSIVDGQGTGDKALGTKDFAIASNITLSISRSTVLGRVHVHTIKLAENNIFDGSVAVAQPQVGGMRFCYEPSDKESRTPRRYRCQPDLAEPDAADRLNDKPETSAKQSSGSGQPQFESRSYGQPGYCQLSWRCSDAIRRGADDNSEMGAFHDLYQPQREDALKARLERYARFGMRTNIIFVT